MKISYKWLIELTGLDWSVEETSDRLTLCGTACEDIEYAARYMDKVVVGEVVELLPIEGASKLQLAKVNIGSEIIESVCGAPNVAVGQKVPLAMIGAKVAGDIVLKKTKIRGAVSYGMICSERELGISQDHSGIMVFDPDAPVGKPLAEYLDFDDYVLTFELTPNRADSMSAIGIARDMVALASTTVKRPTFEIHEASAKASDVIRVEIDDVDACPRYAARIIENVKVGPSPWWVKKKLLMSGIRPISNIVDITNLVMLETGHPLHAFDLDRFGSNEVVVRRARPKEKFVTLDEREHELTPDVLLITNGKEPVAAGGVMGGLNSEVEDDTTCILLEAAYFNPSVIRKSRKVLDTVSESSMRFEKGADPNGIEYAINRAAFLMQELAGGEVRSGIVDNYPKKIEPVTVSFRPERCNAVLGTSLSKERMAEIFTNLEFSVKQSEVFEVTVPTFRPDIEREIDLIEEVARIEGFNAIPDAVTNIGALYTPRNEWYDVQNEIRRILTGSGFDEIKGHGLAQQRMAELLHPSLPFVRVINSVSKELNILRNSLVQTALSVIQHNVAHRNLDLRLFEIGKVYFPPTNGDSWREESRLLMAVTGETPVNWRQKPRPLDFYDLTGGLENLTEHFRWGELRFEPQAYPYLDEHISYDLSVAGEKCGMIGQVSASLVEKLDIKQPVYILELELEKLLSLKGGLIEYHPLPQYPAAPRDIALVVARDVPAGKLVAVVKETAGELAEAVKIFDVYTGKQIEKGKKSVAIAITYRSREGSLSSEQVDEMQNKVIANLKKRFNAEIRDK